jgi:hypothetical protein
MVFINDEATFMLQTPKKGKSMSHIGVGQEWEQCVTCELQKVTNVQTSED